MFSVVVRYFPLWKDEFSNGYTEHDTERFNRHFK